MQLLLVTNNILWLKKFQLWKTTCKCKLVANIGDIMMMSSIHECTWKIFIYFHLKYKIFRMYGHLLLFHNYFGGNQCFATWSFLILIHGDI